MRMIRTCIDLQLTVHRVAQLRLGKHSPNRTLHYPRWLFGAHDLSALFAEAARIAAVLAVEFLTLLAASQPYSLGVHDDDVVSQVKKGGVAWLVLALQQLCRDRPRGVPKPWTQR